MYFSATISDATRSLVFGKNGIAKGLRLKQPLPLVSSASEMFGSLFGHRVAPRPGSPVETKYVDRKVSQLHLYSSKLGKLI